MNINVQATQAIVIELDTDDEEVACDIAKGLELFLANMSFSSFVRTFIDPDPDEHEVGC